MNCPGCNKNLASASGEYQSRVVDSRTSKDGKTLRRRRECLICQSRWTTVEIAVEVQSGKSSSKLAVALQRAALPEGLVQIRQEVEKIQAQTAAVMQMLTGAV